MTITALRGTTDLLPDTIRRWQEAEATARDICDLYGYREIRTPLIEDSNLFTRSVGEMTDIVQKEMYVFTDRGNRQVALRPEATASVVRAYIERHMQQEGLARLYYLGPMFRAERPQAGRLRQFHQVGVEAIGATSSWLDAEVIALADHLLRALGLYNVKLWLGSLGCVSDKQRTAERLKEDLQSKTSQLCEDCQQRYWKNVFRILDCKQERCREIAWGNRTARDLFTLCDSCGHYHSQLKQALERLGIFFDDNRPFIRGLDYYTRTVFEFTAKGLGAQDAVGAGGRYDNLVADLGGPSVGAVGFAIGLERAMMISSPLSVVPSRNGVFVATLGETAQAVGCDLAAQLRAKHVKAMVDYEGKSLKGQLRTADKWQCRYVAILGEQELSSGTVTWRDLETKEQSQVPLAQVVETAASRAGASA